MVKNAFDFWDKLNEELRTGLREVARKYGNNRWWESDDPVTILRHQVEEPFQVVSFPVYLDMLGVFLERPVCHLDFAFNYSQIKEEVRMAVKRRERGIGQSDEQREAAHQDYVRRIEDIVETKLPKDSVMKVDLSDGANRDNRSTNESGYDGWLNPIDQS